MLRFELYQLDHGGTLHLLVKSDSNEEL